jgi:uroporphyrinogen-III synthase
MSATGAAPLAGVGVIVTRPARQAGLFAQKLGVLGARPIVFPAIVILPPDDPRPLAELHRALASYDIAIFVSSNAAEYGVPARPWPASVAAFAPGRGSAAALTDRGVPDVRWPDLRHDSEGLLARPELANVAGKRVAILRGEGGRTLLADTLRARGARVDEVACYRRVAPTAGIDGLRALLGRGEADALTLTSSEGADNFVHVLNAHALAAVRELPTFATHPRIAARARELGLRAIECDSGDAGLVAALLQWFAAHPLRADRQR